MSEIAFDASEAGRAAAASLTQAVLGCHDEVSYLALLHEKSQLLSDELQQHIAQMQAEIDFGVTLGYLAKLLLDSRVDPSGAWRNYRLELDDLEIRAQLLSPKLDEFERILAEGRYEEVLALTDAARPEFAAAGLALPIGRMHAQRGIAYAHIQTGDLRHNADMAILELRAALMLAVGSGQQAQDLMHLGLAFGRRLTGDRAENLESGVNALADAAALAEQSGSPDLLATVRTNLATTLLRREHGDALENRRTAAALCRQALEHRNPTRNVVDWVYSQFTLADALDSLSLLGDVAEVDAIAAYAAILNIEELKAQAPWAHSIAHYGIGRLALRAASAILDNRAPGDSTEHEPPPEANQLLLLAREHLEQSVEAGPTSPNVTMRGRALADLARVRARLGDTTEALTSGWEALRLLTPVTEPYECSMIAWAVADWLADLGRWEEAADAFRISIEAAEIIVHARVSNDAREQEMKRAGSMYRWASYGLARAGHYEEAAFVLDIGRSRELRRRLGTDEYSDPLIDQVPGELRQTYEGAIRDLALSPLGQDGSEAGERLQRVLAEIRYIPGLADFGTKGRPDDLFRSVEDGWPVLYINPTPKGLCLLRVASTPDGPRVDCRLLDSPKSLEVLMRITAGVSSTNPDDWHDQLVSYIGEASGFADSTGARLAEALDAVMPWIGETIMQSVWDFAEEPGIRGITLIPCGPLTLAPLGACPWSNDGRSRCLLDHVAVRYAPSALVAGASLGRAVSAETRARTLVGLADPQRCDPRQQLPAAGPELRSVAQFFDPANVRTAEGSDATSVFLHDHASTCTHLHLACHGRGGVTDVGDALVSLADTTMTAEELAALPLRGSRVVVLSACQTAVQQFNEIPGEALSVSTSFLAAGSACTIASLWSVDDTATAMLMVCVYEEMILNGERPPEALRNAQLWLRDLTPEDELDFLDQHPQLLAEWLRRLEAGDPVGRRGSPQSTETQPFSHPALWAPFVASGV